MYLACDPSVNNLGVCLYDPDTRDFQWELLHPSGNSLVEKLVSIELKLGRFLKKKGYLFQDIKEVICEYPQFFNSQKGAVAKTMGFTDDLACICGYILALCKFAKPSLYKPVQWKGQLTKLAIERRFQRKFGNIPLPSEHECEATLLMMYHLNKL